MPGQEWASGLSLEGAWSLPGLGTSLLQPLWADGVQTGQLQGFEHLQASWQVALGSLHGEGRASTSPASTPICQPLSHGGGAPPALLLRF
jgi:hypothetical protein